MVGERKHTSDAAGSAPSKTKRKFMQAVVGLGGGLVAVMTGVPFLATFFSNPRTKDHQVWREVGPVSKFNVGETVKVVYRDPAALPNAEMGTESAAWLRRNPDGSIVVLSAYCTHVGCPVAWYAGARLFICPCHGGAFYEDGAVAGGPPPKPLPRHQVRIRNGMVELLTRPLPKVT